MCQAGLGNAISHTHPCSRGLQHLLCRHSMPLSEACCAGRAVQAAASSVKQRTKAAGVLKASLQRLRRSAASLTCSQLCPHSLTRRAMCARTATHDQSELSCTRVPDASPCSKYVMQGCKQSLVAPA